MKWSHESEKYVKRSSPCTMHRDVDVVPLAYVHVRTYGRSLRWEKRWSAYHPSSASKVQLLCSQPNTRKPEAPTKLRRRRRCWSFLELQSTMTKCMMTQFYRPARRVTNSNIFKFDANKCMKGCVVLDCWQLFNLMRARRLPDKATSNFQTGFRIL